MKFSLKALLVVVSLVAVLLWITETFVKPARENARIEICNINLRQFALGIHNYESIHGRFPFAAESGPDGLLWHSWRSRIFPHFVQQSPMLYDDSQPWDSPINMRLLNGTPITQPSGKGGAMVAYSEPAVPSMLECPSNKHDCQANSLISYVVITGPGTMFPKNVQTSFNDITDGSANTILLVESINANVQWTEPRDLDIATMSFKINDASKPSISSRHPGGANVAFADGDVYFMTEEITEEELRALITVSGGEDITRDDLIERGILK